jgi:NTE family protein
MRSLCISGGGSMGAWAGGIVENLHNSGIRWDNYFGTSTGSLMIPLISIDEIERLKTAYTTISPNDIFLYNPFKVQRKIGGDFKFKLDHFNIVKNFIVNGTRTLGDSSNLKYTVKNILSESDFNKIRYLNREISVTVCNISTETLEIKKSSEESYNDFIDWVVASASATPFMSLVEKNGYEYADGGILRFVPIIEAIKSGSTHIDIIILMEENEKIRIEKVRNVLHLISKMIKMFFIRGKKDDIDLMSLSKSIKKDSEVILQAYFLPRKITNNPYIFDSEIMKRWWNEGFEHSKLGPDRIWKLKKGKVKKIK